MAAAALRRLDLDVKGVGLGHDTGAAQIVLLRGEGEAVDLAAEADQLNAETDRFGIDRFVLVVGVDVELRIDPVFEDGHLQGEVAVAEHAAPMRAAFVVGGRGGVAAFRRGLFGLGAAAGEQAGGEDQGERREAPGRSRRHQRLSAGWVETRPAWRPVRRSRAA